MSSKCIILAAHPDDELIGCSSLLFSGEVRAVVFPLSGIVGADRISESDSLALEFGYEVWDREEGVDQRIAASGCRTVYVPAPSDQHADHQRVLSWACKHLPESWLWEYSIEKVAPYIRPVDTATLEAKRHHFAKHFTSQLNEVRDPKFFLFEGRAKLGVPDITVTFDLEGQHSWAQAPDEVAFLRNEHRHLFHFRLTLHALAHHDRDVEFFLLQQWAKEAAFQLLADNLSCEGYARQLAIKARAQWQKQVTVEVWEDRENGARVTV